MAKQQTDQQSAYAEAVKRIEHAVSHAHTGITFDKSPFRELESLPESLTAANGVIRHLNVSGTKVIDLEVVKGVADSLNSLTMDVRQMPSLTGIIGELPSLRKLKITNKDGLSANLNLDLTRIESLSLEHFRDVQLTTAMKLDGIVQLYLQSCTVVHLDESIVSRLRRLSLIHTKIENITVLDKLKLVNRIDISGNFSDYAFISGLKSLRSLNLRRSNVKNLQFISELTELSSLNVRDTHIDDLSPVLKVPSLRGNGLGVDFRGADACRSDPILQRISHVKNDRERTAELFDYLSEDTEPESELGAHEISVPEDVPSAPTYILTEGLPLHSVPLIGADYDQSTSELHKEVQRKALDLLEVSKTTNEFAYIRQAAEHYQVQVDRPIDEINLRLLWSSANSLRRAKLSDDRAEQMHRDSDMLPPRIGAALQDLIETHGLFVMGFPEAANLEAEMRSYLTGERDDELRDLGRQIVDALELNPSALAKDDLDAVRDDASASLFDGSSGEMAEIALRSKLWNMVGAAGRVAWGATKTGTKWGTITILSHDFIQFLLGNETLVMSFLSLAQGKLSVWFPVLLQSIRAVLGV